MKNEDENKKIVADRSGNGGKHSGIQNGVTNVKSLTWLQKAAYGLGHMYNDLCASMWFSYTLLFLQVVLDMESTVAGSMLLLGQVMDALATPVVGVMADRWGSKRIWHLAGTGLVLCSFPLIFSRCLGCWMSSSGAYLTWWMPVYYAIVIVIFQCGWAVVQISHLAMIPALTQNLDERSELTAIRYTASVCSGVTVYLITWGVLRIENNNGRELGPGDDYKFRDVALFLTAIGATLTIIFHIGIQYHQNNNKKRLGYIVIEDNQPGAAQNGALAQRKLNEAAENENREDTVVIVKKMNFFTSPLLYQSALLYVASRLFNALSLVYMPLFLDERLNTENNDETVESVASVPLASYISSFFASLLLKYRNKYFSNKILYTLGSVICMIACLWIAISLDPASGQLQLYTVATLLGAGSSVTMVSSLCITADLIGPHADQGAVVYSVVTFADKLITGIAVIVIENYKCTNTEDCPQYYREILAYVCGGSALLGFATISISEMLSLKCCRKRNYVQIP